MDNSMNPYQKFVIFLGSSILVGVGYFVYVSISNNVKDVSVVTNNNFINNFNKIKNSNISTDPLIIEKIIGVYSDTKETSQIIKKLDFRKDGNVTFSTNDVSSESSSTEQVGTWFVDQDNKIRVSFVNINQKITFEIGESNALTLTENSEIVGSKEETIFVKN